MHSFASVSPQGCAKSAIALGESGLDPDLETLRVTYLKGWGINFTSRVKPFIDGSRIDYPDAEVPRGRHSFEIYIEDIDANPTMQRISFRVD